MREIRYSLCARFIPGLVQAVELVSEFDLFRLIEAQTRVLNFKRIISRQNFHLIAGNGPVVKQTIFDDDIRRQRIDRNGLWIYDRNSLLRRKPQHSVFLRFESGRRSPAVCFSVCHAVPDAVCNARHGLDLSISKVIQLLTVDAIYSAIAADPKYSETETRKLLERTGSKQIEMVEDT